MTASSLHAKIESIYISSAWLMANAILPPTWSNTWFVSVNSSLIFSDLTVKHIFITLFWWDSIKPLYCCWHIIMNTLFFCFETKIQMSIVMEPGRGCELTFQTVHLHQKLQTNWKDNEMENNTNEAKYKLN